MAHYGDMAGTWAIAGEVAHPRPESFFSTQSTWDSIFDPDERQRVDPHDWMDGGKYRSIVKLQIRYEGQSPDDSRYAIGTGWLIAPDTLVTAGSNVYDWYSNGETGLGKAVHIKAYIGYHGMKNINSPIVQTRLAKKVVTTGEWVSSGRLAGSRHRDIAMIQLDKPFTGNFRVFAYKKTPDSGDKRIGIVGYPADKTHSEERGAEMYEEYQNTSWNLEKGDENPLEMLRYRISTYGGQIGSPVLLKSFTNTAAIGTHVWDRGDWNLASTIGGPHGNDYDALLKALQSERSAVDQDIKLVKLTASSSTGGSGSGSDGFNASQRLPDFRPRAHSPDLSSEEAFFDVLKTVSMAVIGGGTAVTRGFAANGPLPKVVSPLLGPLGGPLAAIAGAALSTISWAAESQTSPVADHLSSAPAWSGTYEPSEGATERAILAEAALQTVLHMSIDSEVHEKVIRGMREKYTAFAPSVKIITPQLAPALIQSANQIAADGAFDEKNKQKILPARSLPDVESADLGSGGNNFLEMMLLQPSKPLGNDETGFFEELGSFLKKGLNIGKPILRDGAKKGIELLSGLYGTRNGYSDNSMSMAAAAETSSLSVPPGSNDDLKAAEVVVKRALLGEAALLALSELKGADLRTLEHENLKQSFSMDTEYEENFFDFFRVVVQKIGRGTVQKIGVGAVQKAVGLVVNDILPATVEVLAQQKLQDRANAMVESPASGGPRGPVKKPASIPHDELQEKPCHRGSACKAAPVKAIVP
ncbi:hypothetical protein B0H63DRAFT_187295 [Podospora didyma]|uniref:Uncharacterized protein n=1 Tax=Podospora didyma TaxID=330526 RepID=A0AAE0NQD5_9PEZI|nr:hypothetical protein B0H63DRAFT_187295 [Podospora didyma]